MLVLSLRLSHRRDKYVWCTHFIVTGDDNDSDASVTAGLDGILDFLTWWVQHADHTNKGHVCLQEEIKQSYDTSRMYQINHSNKKLCFFYKQKLQRVMTHLEI